MTTCTQHLGGEGGGCKRGEGVGTSEGGQEEGWADAVGTGAGMSEDGLKREGGTTSEGVSWGRVGCLPAPLLRPKFLRLLP